MIVEQVKKSVEQGAVEVMLLGQNVNSYGKNFSDGRKKYTFTNLLQDVSKIEGLERIRFTSPHPLHMDDNFIEEFAKMTKSQNVFICLYKVVQQKF